MRIDLSQDFVCVGSRQQGSLLGVGIEPVRLVFVHKQDESMQDWSQGLYLLAVLILHTSCTELTVTKIRPKNNRWPQWCLSREGLNLPHIVGFRTRAFGEGLASELGTLNMCDDTLQQQVQVQLLFTSLH